MRQLKYIFKNYLYLVLIGVTVVAVAPAYGYTHWREEQLKEQQIKEENERLEALLESENSGNSDDSTSPEDEVVYPSPGPIITHPEDELPEQGNDENEEVEGDEIVEGDANDEVEQEEEEEPYELCLEVVHPGPEEKTLFIGDSRTVGIREYGHLQNIDYFADVGANVYEIWDLETNVGDKGKLSLEKVLESEQYVNIHIMLGINEIGYGLDQTAEKFKEFVEVIRTFQPEARIYIGANLHVTQSSSDTSDVYNNTRINYLNGKMAELADEKTIFYLDANTIFDDENGHLDTTYSSDHAHLVAKYYLAWGQWLMEQLEKYN